MQALFCNAPEIIGRCSDPERVRQGLLDIKLTKSATADNQLPEFPDNQEEALECLSHVAVIPVPKRFGEDECNNWLAFCTGCLRMKEKLQTLQLQHDQPLVAA